MSVWFAFIRYLYVFTGLLLGTTTSMKLAMRPLEILLLLKESFSAAMKNGVPDSHLLTSVVDKINTITLFS